MKCTPYAKELAYTSLVRPLLEYATPAWDPYCAKDINKLEMVQRRAARFAKSDYCRTTSVSKLLDDLGWSTLSDQRKESRLSMFGKAVAGRVSISVDKFSKSMKFTVFLTLPLSPPFPLVQIRINIHSFLVPFVTGIHSPLNHAYS